ncbi:MAG: hypothetical protein DI606_14025 [Sphingobium sp.]|jgi:hypothetical protein|uniref:hypothetical protein n=1 Tax=Sphingobium sp. TaxID=1912891 RepID=UPI000DB5D9BB|nr:hypothetical protein [Sphingobium sp.]PZU09356.1 MAG: hypothetical protein DI606_14025 [Sphingobium sp.]
MTMLISMMLAAAAPSTAAPPPMPTDLSEVPVIENWQGRRVSPRWSEDVARFYRKNKCTGAVPYEGSWLLEIDMLFLLAGDGTPMRIAPVNVQCTAVEKFVSTRILGTLRNSFPKSGSSTPQWRRSQVRFLWSDAP